MDTCTSSLTFKGSISEAITEGQRNKKLFLVYLSGKDEENSITLEQPSWLDLSVAESISRKCVFLHLIQGSVDASNFCAFYPQKSVPSISAVGYNGGKLLWQLEGHISAENLVAAIENTCASLQLQETAATVLTAALAMKNPELSVPVALNILASSTDNHQEAVTVISSEPTAERKSTEHAEETEHASETFSQSIHNNEFENANAGPSVSTIESTVKTPSKADEHDVHHGYTTVEDGSAASQEDSTLSDLGSCSKATIQKFSKENSHISPNAVEESVQDKKNDGSLTNVLKSNDVHLNIRLPDGSPLQAKFLVMDTLRMVKNYVDENQASGIGSYDLAVPYPRRVFSDQDMSKALSELGLVSRETLIVVPHHSVDRSFKGKSPSREHPSTRSGSDYSSDGGYFGYVKRMLSHVNPFSYFSVGASSSNSVPASDGGLWQYRPNSGLQSSLSGEERSYQQYSPNPRTTPSSDDVNKNRKTTTRQFGGNIHTLRDDENESSSRDRNVFWNGNSTQYGGDNNR